MQPLPWKPQKCRTCQKRPINTLKRPAYEMSALPLPCTHRLCVVCEHLQNQGLPWQNCTTAECPAGIYRSLLQKSPIKEPVFCQKEL